MFHLRISLSVLLALTVCVSTSALGQAQYSNRIIAVVDGVPIASSEMQELLMIREQLIRQQHHNDDVRIAKELALAREGAMDTLIDQQILLAEFKKIGGTIQPRYIDERISNLVREVFKGNRDAFVDDLARAGVTIKKFRDNQEKMFIMEIMRQRNSGEHPPATPREVQDYYDKHVDEWRVGDQLKISTITIPKFSTEGNSTPEQQKKLVQELRSRIAAGADFATIAKANSQDSRAENGGAWDWMAKTDMMPAIAKAAMELKTGALSPILEQEASYIIVACDAKKLGEAPPLEKMRPEIEKRIQMEKSKTNIDKWMDTVRKKHVIKKF